jgi:pyruvate,orthophosphate dikinase
MAVFTSWKGNKAIEYRRIERITGLKGTAVNVQAMVFGNMGDNSGTGVRLHPRPEHRRERLLRRLPHQRPGRGRRRRHPHPRADQPAPRGHAQGLRQADGDPQKLESHYKEMQDIEFTVQDGTLYMLQTRTGKRTGTPRCASPSRWSRRG